MHQLFNLLVGAVFFGNFQRRLFFDLFNDVGGDVVRQVMRNNQVALQFFGKGVDDFFNNRNRQFGAINQPFFDVVAFRIFLYDAGVSAFKNPGRIV